MSLQDVIKKGLQDRGYLVRMTQWHEGYQSCAFYATDTRRCYVSRWHPSELEAWQEVWDKLVAEVEVSEAQKLGLVST